MIKGIIHGIASVSSLALEATAISILNKQRFSLCLIQDLIMQVQHAYLHLDGPLRWPQNEIWSHFLNEAWWCYASPFLWPHELLMESNEINSRSRLYPRSWNAFPFCLSLLDLVWNLPWVIGHDSRPLKKTLSGPCSETTMWKSYLFCKQWCRSLVFGGQQILYAQFQCSRGAKNGTGREKWEHWGKKWYERWIWEKENNYLFMPFSFDSSMLVCTYCFPLTQI